VEAVTRPPCTRVPDWWDTGDGGNRLALMICGVCRFRTGTACTAGQPDPQPHGVIRAGVAYNDAGTPLPLCPCGYPQTAYRGGAIGRCPWCAPPTMRLIVCKAPPRQAAVDEGAVERLVAGEPPATVRQIDKREALRRLWAEGLTHREVAARMRMSVPAVRRAYHRAVDKAVA
jgi:hypothetical protein